MKVLLSLPLSFSNFLHYFSNFILLFAILMLVFDVAANAQSTDLILNNGRIFTSDTAKLYVEALAIKNGRIVAAGTDAEINKYKVAGTRTINLNGKLVVPGFNDAHNHLPNALKSTFIDLPGLNPSWQSLEDSLKTAVKRTPPGQFIQAGIGLDIANSPQANRFVLDKLAPEHPILLLSWWGHVGLFNTAGMKKFGISTTQPDPKGGSYERMPDSKTLTGKALEKNAYWPHTSYQKIMALRDDEDLIGKLQGMTQGLLKSGITSYQNMCTGATPSDYIAIWKKAGLPFRLRLIRWADMDPDGTLNIPSKELSGITPGMPLVKVSGTKWLLEGTPLEQGAANIDAYPGKGDWHGRMNYTLPEMEKMCLEAIARKDQICFHIGGSKTIGVVLDMMMRIDVNWKALRPRFEHGDEIDYTPEYLDKARKLGVIIVQNPTHFAPVPGMPPLALATLDSTNGNTPAAHGMAMKTLLKAGIPLAIGSDGPFNPYLNIMLATTHPMRPTEAITREEAVIAYTRTSAFAEFEEHNKGTLTVGKYADLAVLSENIFTAAIPQLMQTESLLTMVNGEIVYDSGMLKTN
jgi:predicted amidohydrolase YtcJ